MSNNSYLVWLLSGLLACGADNKVNTAENLNDSTTAAFTDSSSVQMEQSGELILPKGFKANVAIDEVGGNRHIAVNTNGDIYVKLDRLKGGKGIVVLRDVNKDGKYENLKSFGDYA